MNLDTETLRIYLSDTKVEENECPSPESLSEAAQGQASDSIALHLEVCSDCAEAYRVAFALFRTLTPQGTKQAEPKRHIHHWRTFLVAASLAVVAFTIPWMTSTPPPPAQHRGDRNEEAGLWPADGAFLEQAPETLSWRVRYPDENYRVEVFDAESTPLWTSELLHDSRVNLPQDIRRGMAQGEPYLWRVTYIHRAQKVESPFVAFTLR